MEVTVDCVKRSQPTVGRMHIRDVVICDSHGFLDRILVLSLCIEPLTAKVILQERAIVRLKQDAHSGPVAHIRIEPNDGNVVNYRGAHHACDFSFADSDLLLEALTVVTINTLVDQHVAQITLPVAHEVAVPKIIWEIAEP